MRDHWTTFRHQAEYLLFRSVVCVLQILSPRQNRKLARFGAWLLTDLLPRRMTRYNVAAENIRRMLGPDADAAGVHAIVRDMWEHLLRMVPEMLQASRKLSLTNCRECVVFRDRAKVLEAMTTGRPVMILGGHFGNWEMSMATFGMFGVPMGFIARAMDNPLLHEWFQRGREKYGHRLYLKKGNFDGITDLMGAGGNLGLLGDQDAGGRGVFVDFFGTPASTYKSIALMAMEYKALIVVGYCRRLPDDDIAGRWVRYEVGCEEVIDPCADYEDPIREITERYTQALERAIRRAPEQYFWVHRRWKSEPRRKVRAAERRAA
ncbi:MAG: lysophospholipid acyltransferase family protein [Planctomycetaceae bacterium]